MSSKTAMDIAEKLYQQGILSYPRTETQLFKEGTDLEALLRLQTDDQVGMLLFVLLVCLFVVL